MLRYIALPSLLFTAISNAYGETSPIGTPILIGMPNFRDIAGIDTPYTTTNDGVMRTGVFYRSDALTPTASDLATLNTLNISTVVDMRTPAEAAATPDILPAGASYTLVDVMGSNPIAFSPSSQAEADAVLEAAEVNFVKNSEILSNFNTVLQTLANADAAAIFQCTGGRDRTGWVAAVLQSLAGVSRADIIANYMATNVYTEDRILAYSAAQSNEALKDMYWVKASYLEAGLDALYSTYGSINAYLTEGVGLSQATVYVLRAKMVYYNSLPGQASLVGNASAGAYLLQELQNSSLSGDYTAYNYYLQSAIDAGTLNGVESRVGGQVHADASSYLLRQESSLEQSVAAYTSGIELKPADSSLWMTGLSSYVNTSRSAVAASSSEHSQGTVIGVTQRLSDNLSAYAAFGFDKGNISSAGGEVDSDTTFLRSGVRYALDTLEHGPFIATSASAGWVDYDSKRELGGGLGTANGSTHGWLTGLGSEIGYRSPVNNVILEPSIGLVASHLQLAGFSETGSELALNLDNVQSTRTAVTTGLKASFAPFHAQAGWDIVPSLQVGYERVLGGYQSSSEGELLGLTVSQHSDFDGRDHFFGSASLSANLGHLGVAAKLGASEGGGSRAFGGSVEASYRF